MLTLIASVDINNGIGRNDGSLLFKLPDDMKHFKEKTTGKIVVFGRRTWLSLPKKPLEGRKNYVMTKNKDFPLPDGVERVHRFKKILKLAKTNNVFICGGAEIYQEFIKHADRLLITHVHVIDASAEVFFPHFDHTEWKVNSMEKHEEDDNHPHSFTFTEYIRK